MNDRENEKKLIEGEDYYLTPEGYKHGVQLVEEEDAGSGLAGLLEHVADVRLGLAEPHGEELRPLDRDEVGLALVGDGLRHQCLTASGGAVEEHPLAGGHAELLELFGVFHWVLHELLEVALRG